ELALESLLHDLHVKQPEETAPEAEAQRRRRFRLVEERCGVQPQLLGRSARLRILVPFDRIKPGEHHRLQLLEAWTRLDGGTAALGYRVADFGIRNFLDVRD